MRISEHLRELLKVFLVIPYLFVISLPEIVFTEKENQELIELIWYSIFGRISSGNINTIILTLDNLGIIILYCLIYGNYVSKYFDERRVFIFTRVDRRSTWTISKISNLLWYTIVYSGVFLLFKLLISLRRVMTVSFDKVFVQNVGCMWMYMIALLGTLGILMNLISLYKGASIGISSVILLILILEFAAIMYFDRIPNIICNPLCFNKNILSIPAIGRWKIFTESLYFVFLSFLLVKCVEKKDL